MLWLQVFAAVASMVVNFLAFFQSMYVVGWNGGLRLTVQGNTTYPPVTSVFNVSSTFDDPLFITLAFLEGQIAFYFMNFLFSLGSLVLAGVVLRQGSRLPDPDLIMPMPPLGKVPYDRYRVGASSLSALLVIVFWIAYSFISVIQSFGGWVFLTLFPNSANSMLLMMLVLSIYPPMGDGPLVVITNNGVKKLESEDSQRYNTGVGEQSVHFFFGWILAVVFSVWTVINNSNWRTANSMPITCGDLVSFMGNSTTFTGFGVPISFFGHQTVRYAPFLEGNSANGQNVMQASSSLTCMDDIFNWILLFFGFIVFICGSCTVFISLCPRNRHLQAHQKETGFSDKQAMRDAQKRDNDAIDPQGGEARKTKKGKVPWPRFRRPGGLNIPIS
jgi:hypothetical protein